MYNPVPAELPHRPMYWHINAPYKFLIYPLMLISLGFAAYGLYRRIKFWWEGQPQATRSGSLWARIKVFIWDVPFQRTVLREALPGIMHGLIFWGFLALTFVTMIVFVDVDFGVPVYRGNVYLALTLLADLTGLALLVGILIAASRRYIKKPDRLDNRWDDAFVLITMFLMVASGFALEGLRIHYNGDTWAMWSPVGQIVSYSMGHLGEKTVGTLYKAMWWFHFSLLFVFVAAFPYSKLFHIVALPANIIFASNKPKGALSRVDIEALMNDPEAAENFNVGVTSVKDQTWKQRLDYDACIRCGRCQDNYPAYQNQHPLSPKKLIQDLKTFSRNNQPSKAAANTNGNGTDEAPSEPLAIVGGAFDPVTIWECRTCGSCMDVCPARIDHISHVMELRRAEVMMRGQLPQDASIALKTMERAGNPFGPQEARAQWIQEAQIPVIGPGEECDVLFWIGCCTTYDLCKQKVAHIVLKILKTAGLSVGVLGDEEQCCGDPARSLGDENVFQTLVKNQIESIQSRKFKYLVAHCAHCFNVFKNEYPQFGATFKVLHHTELISQLLKEGRLEFKVPIERTVTYHDPCYLGRFNNIYEQPREILKSIKGISLVEMEHNREKARCCGGGGGHYWMDIANGERLNVARGKEACDTGAEIITVGCIYCLHMMDDAVKILNVDDKMAVYDISELVIIAMGGEADARLTCAIQEERLAA